MAGPFLADATPWSTFLRWTTGKEIKEIDAGAYIAASVALAGNRAYFGHYDNEFLCVDLARTTWPGVITTWIFPSCPPPP